MNPIVRKIQKLLALAGDQEGLPEGESAAKLAEKLMRAHAIQMADLPVAEQEKIDPLVDETIVIQRLAWYAKLMWALGSHTGCKPYRQSNRWDKIQRKYVTRMRVIGYKSDVEIIEYLYGICLKQINDAYISYRNFCKEMDGEAPGRAEAIAFKASAVRGLDDKLVAMRGTGAREDSTGTALVLARSTLVEAWAQQLVPNAKAFRSTSSHYSMAGYEAGQKVNLSTGVTSAAGTTKQLGGK